MKYTKQIILSLGACGTILFFQNCGGTKFSDGTPVSNDSSAAQSSASTPSAAQAAGASSGGSSSAPSTNVPPAAVTPSVNTSGSTVTNQAGQTIQFNANDGTPLGNTSLISKSGSSFIIGLYNPLSGRQNRVFVNVDPSTGKFVSVTPATPSPFMCHDPYNDPCRQGYVQLTDHSLEPNCNSPINYSGTLNGSVNNITTNAWMYYSCQ